MERGGVLLIGGGIDSTTLLAYLASNSIESQAKTQGIMGQVELLHVDYGQKAFEQERSAILYFAKKYEVRLHTMACDLRPIAYASILKGTEVGKTQLDNRLEGRNVVLIGLAATLASTLDVPTVWVGFHREPKERPFPDATIESLQAMNIVLSRSYGKRLEVKAPFWNKTRLDIFQMGRALDPEIETKSWTCYGAYDLECGECTHCIAKKQMQKELAECAG